MADRARTALAMRAFERAERDFREAYGVLVAARGLGEPRTQGVMTEMVALYKEWEAAEPGKGHGAAANTWEEIRRGAQVEGIEHN